ncbi:MAG: GH116 family glycosyl-hydrolase [Candidatus Latescibacterota bacterium]
MNIWITEEDKLESRHGYEAYAFEVPLDGFFVFHIWAVWKHDPGSVEICVNDTVIFKGTGQVDQMPYWRCGSVALARGFHRMAIKTGCQPERLFLSDQEDRVATGDAQMLWDNRQATGKPFEVRETILTEDQRLLLRRHGFLFDHEHDAEKCEVPSGVPFGGIGAGKVELTPDGLFTALTINNNQDCPIYRMPGSFFALQTEAGGRGTTRLLQRAAVDQLFVPVERIEGDAAFPEIVLTYRDPSLPLEVSLHAFSPHIPHNIFDSSLPCAFFRFTLKNPTADSHCARLLFSWENTINTGGSMALNNKNEEKLLPLVYHTWNYSFAWSNREGNVQEEARLPHGTGVRFFAPDDQGNPNSFGEHMIWTPEDAQVVPDRDLVADEAPFAAWFESGCGEPFAPAGNGEFRAGALVVERTIASGETATVDFVLSWAMPHALDRSGKDCSVYYANHFSDAGEGIAYAWRERDRLLRETRALRVFLETSSLPSWLVNKLLDCRFVAHTNTTLTREGLFSVNESPTGMCGCLGTLDQRTCSGAYWTACFPDLDARELFLFTLRQGEGGNPSHDLGSGTFSPERAGSSWPDLAAAYVVQVHRHFLRTGGRAFLQAHWPSVKAALGWAIGLDDTGDAIPILKPGRGTTYDNQQWDGISAFIATMHEAGLTLGADLAERSGEEALSRRFLELARQANESRKRLLWVAEEESGYFRNVYDPAKKEGDDSCFICSLAGDWAMAAGGMEPRLPQNMLHQALESIRRKNMFEEGMTDQSARAQTTSAFVQYPVAYFGAAALFFGRSDLAWDFLALHDRIVTRSPSTRTNQALTYEADGTPQGLPYYMTAPVTWLFLDGLSGVVPDVDRHRLQIGSDWLFRLEGGVVPVVLSSSWFMLACFREEQEMRLDFVPVRAEYPFRVTELVIRVPDGEEIQAVSMNGTAVQVQKESKERFGVPTDFDPGKEPLSLTFRFA